VIKLGVLTDVLNNFLAASKPLLDAGAKVIVVGTKEELGESCVNEIKAAGGEAIFCKTDVTSDESLDNLVKTALDAYGKIDILVNNAGVGGTTANMDQITMDEWNTVLATNLTAPFVLCKKLIPIMEKQGVGTIVNVASMAATAAGRGGLAYTSAKHGLLGLTRQMSLDHGRTGVRINAVLPGPIATDMIARVLAIPQHPVTMKIGMSPAKRPGEPIEVAQAIAFLASDEASFIHGAALAVDGGYTIFLQWQSSISTDPSPDHQTTSILPLFVPPEKTPESRS
jgi:NAD(P)-dependent dehydrogenase (short-subunit alcohol dehydrogenase family)